MRTGTYQLLTHQAEGPRIKQDERQKEGIREWLWIHICKLICPQEAQLGALEYF